MPAANSPDRRQPLGRHRLATGLLQFLHDLPDARRPPLALAGAARANPPGCRLPPTPAVVPESPVASFKVTLICERERYNPRAIHRPKRMPAMGPTITMVKRNTMSSVPSRVLRGRIGQNSLVGVDELAAAVGHPARGELRCRVLHSAGGTPRGAAIGPRYDRGRRQNVAAPRRREFAPRA